MPVIPFLRFLKVAFFPSFQAFWAKYKLLKKVLTVARPGEPEGVIGRTSLLSGSAFLVGSGTV